jgi:hypothetical protein
MAFQRLILQQVPAPFHNNGLQTTPPTTQAGHQTHHTTTCVHRPCTLHPNAASTNTLPTSTPQNLHIASTTTGGDSNCNSPLSTTFRILLLGADPGVEVVEKGWPTKERGEARRPMRKAREKLSVASVARNMPRRRREKHCRRRRCWGVGGDWRERRVARRVGRARLARAKVERMEGRACDVVSGCGVIRGRQSVRRW